MSAPNRGRARYNPGGAIIGLSAIALSAVGAYGVIATEPKEGFAYYPASGVREFPTLIKTIRSGNSLVESISLREGVYSVTQLDRRMLYVNGRDEVAVSEAKTVIEQECGPFREVASNHEGPLTATLELNEPQLSMGCLERGR